MQQQQMIYTRDRNDEEQVIREAQAILYRRMRTGDLIGSPQDATAYLQLRLADLPHEVFAVLFLDNKHRVIAFEEMFRGTIDAASVYPREVVKAALQHNAAAVILSHNHPSNDPTPSRADERLTKRLVEALGLVDVRVIDHVVVTRDATVSFAERGLL